MLNFYGSIVENSPLTFEEKPRAAEKIDMTSALSLNKNSELAMEIISKTKEAEHERWHIRYIVDDDKSTCCSVSVGFKIYFGRSKLFESKAEFCFG